MSRMFIPVDVNENAVLEHLAKIDDLSSKLFTEARNLRHQILYNEEKMAESSQETATENN